MKLIHALIILTFVCVLLAVSAQQGCELEPECHISLCDCKCHLAGQTPEELESKICGINCYGLYNITG